MTTCTLREAPELPGWRTLQISWNAGNCPLLDAPGSAFDLIRPSS